MSIFYFVMGLVLFVGLVVLHEFGHFVMARKNGVDVEEFGIGFPPRLWKKKMPSGFLLTLNALPLGGFVRMKGENDSASADGSFGAAPLGAKIKILLAGVAANLVIAIVLFTVLAAVGMPKMLDNQFSVASDTKVVREVTNKGMVLIETVFPNSPAELAGLRPNDQLLSINGTDINRPDKVSQTTAGLAGSEVSVKVKRNDQIIDAKLKLNTSNTGQGLMGIATVSGERGFQLRRSTWSAPIVAVGLTKQISILTYKGVGSALLNLVVGNPTAASQSVSGPIGIFSLLQEGSSLGLQFVLMIVAIISLTLALINALPIPALDGGRLFVMLAFRLAKKPLTKKRENLIHGTGFIALMILFVLITIVDVRRLGG